MKKLIACIALISFSAIASDLSTSRNTRDFCSLANEFGYQTKGFKASSEGCGTPMVEISKPGRNGLGNNLAYYATGKTKNPEVLDFVSFILNVNNVQQKIAAQKELFRVSSKVGINILGKLPSDFEKVVINGKSKSWVENNWEIQVTTTKWTTGQGQDTRIVFSPK